MAATSGVWFAEDVEHALCRQVPSHPLPHDVAQLRLRDVQPDAHSDRRKLHQAEPVGDDEHAVDGDLDPDDVVVCASGPATRGTADRSWSPRSASVYAERCRPDASSTWS